MALLTIQQYWSSTNVPAFVTVTFDTVTKAVTAGVVQWFGTPEAPGTFEPLPDTYLYQECDGNTLDRVLYRGSDNWAYDPEYESAACVVGCTLLITSVTATPEHLNNSDGTLTVVTSGGTPPLAYSLDNVVFRSSGVFTGLSKQAGTVYVRDSSASPCFASAPYAIGREVYYNERYRLDFDDLEGTPASLVVELFGYEGDVEYVCGGASPVLLRVDTKDSMYEPLMATFLSLSFLNEPHQPAGHFLPMATGDELDYRVTLTVGGTVRFRGFVQPDLYSEPFIAPPYDVAFTATDGLSSLKETPFADALGDAITGRRTVLETVLDCLAFVGTELDVLVAVDVYAQGMDGELDPLSQAYIDAGVFTDKNLPGKAWDVLEGVLKPFGANIFQWDGAWWIVSRDALRYGTTAHRYTASGDYLGAQAYPAAVETAPPAAEPFYVTGGQRLDILPAAQRTEVKASLKLVENLIPRGDLYDADFAPVPTIAPLEPGYVLGLRDWARTYSEAKVVESASKGENALYLPPASRLPNGLNPLYIESPAIPLDLAGDTAGFIQMDIEYEVIGTGDDTVLWYMAFYGVNNYSLKDVDAAGWAQNVGNSTTEMTIRPEKRNEKATLSFKFYAPSTGEYFLRLYAPYSGNTAGNTYGIKVYSLKARYYPGGNIPLDIAGVGVDNKNRYTTGTTTVETVLGDVPRFPFFTDNENRAHHSVWRSWVDNAIGLPRFWYRKGLAEELELLQILAVRMAYARSLPAHRVTGTLQGILGIGTLIRETMDGGRLYVPVGLSWDVRARQVSLTMDELQGTLLAGTVGEYERTEYNEAEHN